MMKQCRKMPLLISRSIDNDLNTEETGVLTTHLAACGKCKRIREQYLAQKDLCAASFSEEPIPVGAITSIIAGNANRNFARTRRSGFYRFAVTGFVMAAAVAAVFFFIQPSQQTVAAPSFLLESVSPSTMCIPFSSIVYYEEYAGNAVHSQFVKVAPQRSHFAAATAQQVAASYYESPLLGDNVTTLQQYNDGVEQ